jgi:hypothetical protein
MTCYDWSFCTKKLPREKMLEALKNNFRAIQPSALTKSGNLPEI